MPVALLFIIFAVGSMTIPILTGLGYDLTFSTAVVAVAGGLGVIIPPSIPFIMYGMASGSSVSDLFLAGIIPGFMIGGLLMFYAVFYCRRHGEDKEKIHAEVKRLHNKGFWNVLKESFFAILILTPILLPLVTNLGMDPIQFGMIMVVNLAVGFVTPPIGVNLFVASSLTDVPVMKIARKSAPMIAYFLAALLLITFIPAISLALL